MHEYDTVLKSLLQDPNNSFIERITRAKIGRWLNVELPEVTQPRVDLLGETADGQRLLGIELQSANDSRMPLRMADIRFVYTGCMSGFRSNTCSMSGMPP